MSQPCSEERRIARIEQDVQEVREMTQQQERTLSDLSRGEAETRVYLKQIFERLDDLKFLFGQKGKESDTQTQLFDILREFIKWSVIIAGIIAGIRYIA